MKKVLVILPNQSRTITNKKTAISNDYVITHNVEVDYLGREVPDKCDYYCTPTEGNTIHAKGHFYKINKLQKVNYKCTICGKPATHYIGTSHYCTSDFRKKTVTRPIKRNYKKQQRNMPCQCRSGKKYKHCCFTYQQPSHIFNSEYKDDLKKIDNDNTRITKA